MSGVDGSVALTLAALVGLAAGSFLNVLIIRTHHDTSLWRGRSACPHCGHVLSWYEMFPFLSFVLLRGRCRHCRRALSWQYPIVELATAGLFMVVLQRFGLTWWSIWGWVVTSMMIAIAVYDGRWSLLPDSFTVALAIAGAGFALAAGGSWPSLVLGAIAGAGFFGSQYLFSRGRWVGSGDILLGGALGVMLGWRMLSLALLMAYLSGAVVASVLLLTRRRTSNATLAFGPFLVLSGFAAWLWGQEIINWYFSHALFR